MSSTSYGHLDPSTFQDCESDDDIGGGGCLFTPVSYNEKEIDMVTALIIDDLDQFH